MQNEKQQTFTCLLAVRAVCIARDQLAIVQQTSLVQLSVSRIMKGKGSPCSITERRVPELILVLGSQPAGDVNHKPGGRLPLLSGRPAVTPQFLRGLLPILLLGE